MFLFVEVARCFNSLLCGNQQTSAVSGLDRSRSNNAISRCVNSVNHFNQIPQITQMLTAIQGQAAVTEDALF
ncbi:MAG: hypothetical protein AAF387_15370 [Pseudomonadota bacterium]